MRLIFTITFLFFFLNVGAQILNMDRASSSLDSNTKWKSSIQIGSDFSSEKKIFDISTKSDVTRFFKSNHFLSFIFINDFTSEESQNISNSGFLHLRYRDNDTRKLSMEYFTQYQWDDLRGMLNRYLFGDNLRIRLKESKNRDAYLGIGIMYEFEKWNYDGVDPSIVPLIHPNFIETRYIKANQYIKISTKLFDSTELTFTNFIQTRLDKNFINPRIATFMEWSIPVSKSFSIGLEYDDIYDFDPVVPISKFYWNYSTTFTLNLK